MQGSGESKSLQGFPGFQAAIPDDLRPNAIAEVLDHFDREFTNNVIFPTEQRLTTRILAAIDHATKQYVMAALLPDAPKLREWSCQVDVSKESKEVVTRVVQSLGKVYRIRQQEDGVEEKETLIVERPVRQIVKN